ncbi:MAG: hypothetical protein ABR567_00140 [Myxococcales bacterium]|nr:hypothetical protein [Myxococcales bacterium]
MDHQAESGRIQQLLDEIRDLSPGPAWERVEELMKRLLALYGEGLSRLLTLARAGGDFDVQATRDELVSSLLLLHGLHPAPARERVLRALDELKPFLDARGARAELIAVEGEVARVRFAGVEALQPALRRAVEDAAPELQRVEIEGAAEALVPLRISP